MNHLKTTFQVLKSNRLFVKKSKCTFVKGKVEYLGHIITGEGVTTNPKKVTAMVEWPTPTTIKEFRSFLGLTGYYRKFIRSYGMISKPLTKLLKKNGFEWSGKAKPAFNSLKRAMTQAPILALSNFTKPFILEIDACDTGVGAMLVQEGRSIAFLSQALAPKHLGAKYL